MTQGPTLDAGIRLHNAGRLAEAEACYRALLDARPDDADALHLLGVLNHQRGNQDEAERLITAALAQRPNTANFHLNLGNVLHAQQRFEEAAACYQRALALQPDFFWAHNNLGNALSALDRPRDAVASLERALALDASVAATWSNLGTARRELGELDRAVDAYQEALRRDNRLTEAWGNLGNVLFDTGDFDAAKEAYRATAALDPGHRSLQWNWSLVDLARGDLAAGWERYEHRWIKPEIGPRRRLPMPRWQGESLQGRSIAIWGEQGVGDEILFATCVPDVAENAGHCVLECDPRLQSLFARAFPRVQVVARQHPPEPRFLAADLEISSGSLAQHLRRSIDAFPQRRALFAPDPQRLTLWRERLAALGPGPTLGITWRSGLRGSLRNRNYMAIADLAPLFALPGFVFVNLQYDDCAAELAWVRSELGVEVHTWPDLDLKNDFESVAALLCALDHVVTPVNAVSALAGALDLPAWRFGVRPDAIATLGQSYSPWFPSLRLAYRNWDEPWSKATDLILNGLGPTIRGKADG